MTGAALTVEGVSVTLGGRQVLDGVTFTVAEGGFCGLIGSNGAGKTTLLRAALGLVTPDRGRITVAAGADDAPAVGYVPQKISLEPDVPLRARDLVGLGLDGHRFGFGRRSAADRQAVDDMLDAVGATSFADARVGTLSGGEQQRVMIAHALVGRPRLLLADEPLANLDLRASGEVVELLARVGADQGVAVLLSAHDMNPLLGVVDQVVYLADGRAVSGRPEEVVTTETLSALYRHPVEVIHAQGRVLVVAGPGATPDGGR
ncbi:MAG TPA: metal ABC transporter ATP-binding protein [Acidimicrobiales bacterium]|nr:metal ABC transporter ATP-binding protein [Acidimicrobiales bacterium]